ncbi:lipopolysaccharide biosynthesis protein [Pelagicoccus sp. NFK12]|uniref:Lipopolysaccharide biosynthesis protein n=1 Tax=Pelagicoccus enzymogenes TaxID=2773457 RepID=A0A927FDK8_9BACT|nr:lipopolysaccharide biosynthesis protein [Pelagicoccus enzymogenes]MBD5781458.1 lipopolysaccharide biosynthesis protein [Pelagicoccus enzymogenes]
MINLSNIISGIKWTTLSSAVVSLCAIIKIAILTRYLDKEDFGTFALTNITITLATLISESGICNAMFHKKRIPKKTLSSLFWLAIAISCAVYICILFLSSPIEKFYKADNLSLIINTTSIYIIINTPGRFFRTLINKNMLFSETTKSDLTGAITGLIASTTLAICNFQIWALVLGHLIQALTTTTLLCHHGSRHFRPQLHFSLKSTRSYLKIGLYQTGGQLANFAGRDIDIILIGKFFSPETLGGYSLAKELALKPAAIIGPVINKVLTPTLAGSENADRKQIFLSTQSITSYLGLLLYATLALSSNQAITFAYGSSYSSAATIFSVFCIIMIFRLHMSNIGNLITATGRTHLDLIWNLIVLTASAAAITLTATKEIQDILIAMLIQTFLLIPLYWIVLIRTLTGASAFEYITSTARIFAALKQLKMLRYQ